MMMRFMDDPQAPCAKIPNFCQEQVKITSFFNKKKECESERTGMKSYINQPEAQKSTSNVRSSPKDRLEKE